MGRRAVRWDIVRGGGNKYECGLPVVATVYRHQNSLGLQLASKMAGKKGERAGWRSGAAVIFGVGIWGSPRVRANASHLMPWQAPIPLTRQGLRRLLGPGATPISPMATPIAFPTTLPASGHGRAGRRQWPSASDASRFRWHCPAQRPVFDRFWQRQSPDCDDDVRSQWRPARNARTAGVLANWELKSHRRF